MSGSVFLDEESSQFVQHVEGTPMSEVHHGPPTPGPEHALLKPFEGRFRATVTLWMGPGEPMVHTGLMLNVFQLNGLFLFQDYVGDPSTGPWPAFEGKGFWGYNTTTKEFEGVWLDNASTIMQMEKGSVDSTGKVWTMISTFVSPYTGQLTSKRNVIRLIDGDHNDMTTWMASPDGQEFKAMHIDFVRV